MKIQQVDDTPIKNIEEDWGNPDGTGKKAKTLGQVQKFIKAKINEIENKTVRIEKSNEEFESKIINQIENYKPVEIHGDVTNAADEEDLTSKDGLLKIKNRNNLNGKGFVILRQSKTRSGSKTILTQEHFSQENTIYEIRYNFDLGGQTIKIPKGCTLKFVGGSFDNGCLLGDNTAIEAGAYKIFGDVLYLHQYCFATKSGNYGENIYELSWLDVNSKTLRYSTTSTKRSWILSNDSGVRASNYDGGSHFRKADDSSNIEFKADSEFLLNANPGSFSKIDTSTKNVVENNLNTLAVLNLSFNKKNNLLTVPKTAKWAFFSSNNPDDDLNATYLSPGSEIDLGNTAVYCTSLNRAFICPEASTWCSSAKLEWFVGSNFYKSFSDFNESQTVADQSGNIQKALDCSMDIESYIRGIIPCENSLYAEVRKKINLGAVYNLTDDNPFRSNAQYKVKFSLPSTVILGLADKDLFVQRTTLSFYGGLLTTTFAPIHNKSIWAVDMHYLTSYSDITTSLLGKSDGDGICTKAAFIADANNILDAGYTSFSTYNIYAKCAKYGIYAAQNAVSYINSSNINAYIFDYYEGVHIESSFGASIINATLQAGTHTPLSEFEEYRHAYIKTARSTINLITWDFGDNVPESRKILILGDNYIVGNSNLATAFGSVFIPYKDNAESINREIIVTNSGNTKLRLPRLQNTFAGITSDTILECYFQKIKSPKEIDISKFDDKITNLEDSEITKTAVSTSIYVMGNLFSTGTGFLSSTTLDTDEFVEAYVSLKDNFLLDKGIRFKKIALDFSIYANIFPYAKIIFIDTNEKKYVRDISLRDGQSFALFDMKENFLEKIKACILRLYGEQENNWGLGYSVDTNTYFMPQIRGYSLHESNNYFERKFQPIAAPASGYRPTDALSGQMCYDSTLKKPIWMAEINSEWIDPTTIRVEKINANDINIVQGERVVHQHTSSNPLTFNFTGLDGLATNRAYSFELDLKLSTVPSSLNWKENDVTISITWLKPLELEGGKRYLISIDKNGNEYIGMYTVLNL